MSDEAVVAATFSPFVADALRGIDVRTGTELWEQVLPSGALFIPKFDLAGSVLVVEDATGIHGYDATTGRRRWDLAGQIVRTKPGGEPPVLLVREPSGALTRLDPSDGSRLWRLPKSSTVAPIAVGHKLILLSARTDADRDVHATSSLKPRQLMAIDAESGRTRWKTTVAKEVAPGYGQSAVVGPREVILSGGCNVVPE